MKKHSTTVLIVGGSVAGLAAANLLERSGVDFLLLEKHKEVAPNLGACIVVFPNGARILDQLGCWDAVVEILGECDTFRRFQARDIRGRLSQDIRTVCEELQERFDSRKEDVAMNCLLTEPVLATDRSSSNARSLCKCCTTISRTSRRS